MVTVVDVASGILERCGALTTMKMQKLAFYCQAQSLVMTGGPLFDEDFQAWMNGPVVPGLFRLHKGRYFVEPGFFAGDGSSSRLSGGQARLLVSVCDVLTGFTGRELSLRVKREAPWRDARGGLPLDACGGPLIAKTAMRDYYSGNPIVG